MGSKKKVAPTVKLFPASKNPRPAIRSWGDLGRLPGGIHAKSPVFVLVEGVRVPVTAVRVTFGTEGQPDIVEILSGLSDPVTRIEVSAPRIEVPSV